MGCAPIREVVRVATARRRGGVHIRLGGKGKQTTMLVNWLGRIGVTGTAASTKSTLTAAARLAGPAARGPVLESLEGRTLWSATGGVADLVGSAAPVASVAALTASAGTGKTTGTTTGSTPPATKIAPSVLSSTPANGATGVALDAALTAEVSIPNGGINAASLAPQAVRLVRVSDGYGIPSILNTSGGGDVIVLKPKSMLEAKTQYKLIVTDQLKDVSGASFAPTTRTFTTGALPAGATLPTVKFEQVALEKTAGREYFGLTIGPDHKLYAGTNDGLIVRFDLAADGTVTGDPKVIDTIKANNAGEARFVVGFAFDPKSTADNLILWVTHTAPSSLDVGGTAGPDFTGKLSVLTGPDLGGYHDAVVNLPRSVRDHLTNQPVFGPDGAVYFSQPSNSAMGAPDAGWGNRSERLLSATILRLDVNKLGGRTLDAKTEQTATPYNPFAADAPLTIYAYGVRNAFDLVWASDGKLYAVANGSAAGGSTPAGPGSPGNPGVPAIASVNEAETDYLFRIEQGKYYGHPNPLHKQYVLNGGNPTAGHDPYEVPQYPVGTQPDPDWQPAFFDLGPHQAPVGALQYHGSAFGGVLDGKLLIARYSGGDDVVAIDLGGAGKAPKQYSRIEGLTNINNPSDLVQDPKTGHLYVAELGNKKIRLIRPAGSGTTGGTDSGTGSAGGGTGTGNGGTGGGTTQQPGGGTTSGGTGSDGGTGGTGSNGGAATGQPQSLPDPVEIPLGDRTKKEIALMKQISKFAVKNSLAIPDFSTLPGADLKATLADLKADAAVAKQVKKVVAAAAKKDFALPADLSDQTVAQLKVLLAQIKKYKPAA